MSSSIGVVNGSTFDKFFLAYFAYDGITNASNGVFYAS